MKAYMILFLLIVKSLCVFSQGIVSGDIMTGVSGGLNSYEGGFEMNTFTQEPRSEIVVDWGDGNIDTVTGPSFLISQNFYGNIYQGYHTYQDTGYYTITYSDDYWIEDIANFDDSGSQPFVLKADIWLTNDPNYSHNKSIFFSAPADYIYYDNGVVTHELVPSDLESDSVSQELIPVPAPGYFLPDATDSLVCCLTWDKPIQPGKYAFGFEVTDWRNGVRMGSVQRFITVEVDTVFSHESKKERDERGLLVFPNPAESEVKVFFNGPFVLDSEYKLKVMDQLGRQFFFKPVNIMEYAGGIILDVSTWPPGVYFFTLSAGGQVWTEKAVIRE